VYDIFSFNSSGSVSNYVGRVRQTPNPSGVGMLDLARYLQNQTESTTISNTGNLDIVIGGTNMRGDYNPFSYIVFCGEEYSNTLNGPVTLYNGNDTLSTGTTLTSVSTSTGFTFNAVKQFEEGFVWDPTQYVAPTGRKLLTNSPRTLYMDTDEYFTMTTLYGVYSGVSFGITGVTNAEVYDVSGNLIKTYAPSGTIATTTRIRSLYSNNTISTIVSGFENTWNKILIGFGNFTEKITIFRKDCNWDKYDPKDVIFLNRLGGWDTFRFYGSKNEEVKIERATYKRAYGTWSSATYNYTTNERGTTNIKTDLTVEGEVMSDFLDIETTNWLEELLTSPEVFMIEGVKLIPINITDSSFKRQIRGNVKLRQLSFRYEKSNDTRTQQQ
jgi:hypothetical protein